jgi:cyclophilin family peptidyl-prolyl cis-trans isomerase
MTHRLSAATWTLAILVGLLLLGRPLWAEDGPDPQPAADDTPAAVETDPPTEAEAVPADAEADPAEETARATFDAVNEQFRDLVTELRRLQTEYESTDVSDTEARAEIREQYREHVSRGNQLLPQLLRAAMQAYLEAPNEDRELTRFLVKALQDSVDGDRYERALEIGEALVANDCLSNEIYELTGVASFALHKFEAAAELLERAKSVGEISDSGLATLTACQNGYPELWREEQELRAAEAEADDLPRVKLTTSQGEIVLELFENQAPGTVGNFVNLVESGFYDGLTFHRVLPGFMAQGGCPNGDGSGGPGYNILSEYGSPDARMHFRGSLSMANTGQPNSGGSQFFITFLPTPQLNNRHTVFGRVIEGMDVVVSLQRIDPSDPSDTSQPDTIVKAEVLRKRDHEYLPQKAE